MTVKNIEKYILQLNPLKRIKIAEHILASLNEPNSAIEKAWGNESDKRLLAFKNGKIKGLSLAMVKKRLAK